MLETLKARKEALEAQGKKGFTLMEMLIVIAIIAILIAIAIPIFTSQLENSRDTTSVANIRSAYAEAQAAYLTGKDTNSDVEIKTNATTGVIETIEVSNVMISTAESNTWSSQATNLPWDQSKIGPADPGGISNATAKKVAFTYDANGEITAVAIS